MQFVIIAEDYQDELALERRLKAREAHIANTEKVMSQMIMGVATLNSEENMNGSIMIVEFSSRTELDKWLESEPYVTNKVWEKITIKECKVGPSFLKTS